MDIYISPMAGVTDYSYRKIMAKFNPNLMFTEMVNSSLLLKDDNITVSELLKCDSFHNTGTQVFGSNKREIVDSFLKLEDMGFDIINLNMGCPQPKIIKGGSGCSLLLQRDLVEDILCTLKEKLNTNTKISIKIRIGYKNFNEPEFFVKLSEKYKLDFICVHGRTQEQIYSGKANWNKIRELSEICKDIKFIGNGDIFNPRDMQNKLSKSINGIMLARGIVGNPWLIQQCKRYFKGEDFEIPKYNEIKNMLMEHLYILRENKGEIAAAMEINKFIPEYFKDYMKNVEFSKVIKEIILNKNFCEKMKKVKEL